MFDFDRPEDGSEDRFNERLRNWKMGTPYQVPFPVEEELVEDRNADRSATVRHYGWWLLHNVVAHPLIGVIPVRTFFRFHDWTSRKLNGF